MELKNKKFLAVSLGFQFNNKRVYISHRSACFWIIWEDWNPDVNPEQFKEVLENLSEEGWDSLEERFEVSGVRGYLWISDNMPKIIEEIIAVLK